MPRKVARVCKTCRWCGKDAMGDARVCDRIRLALDDEDRAWIVPDARLIVMPDFGCTLWKGKGGKRAKA